MPEKLAEPTSARADATQTAAALPQAADTGVDEAGETGEPSVAGQAVGQKLSLEEVRSSWPEVLARMKAQSPKLHGLLSSAEPIRVRGNKVTLGCEASFHRDRLADVKRRDLVEQVLSKVLGRPCRIECVVQPAEAGAPRRSSSPSPGANQPDGKDAQEDWRQKLLSHPAVKELQKRGGRVSRVDLFEVEEQEEDRG